VCSHSPSRWEEKVGVLTFDEVRKEPSPPLGGGKGGIFSFLV